MATPLSVRLTEETKEEFKELVSRSGQKQEEFFQALLASYRQQHAEAGTDSAVAREQSKVAAALAQVQRVVVGFLEIANQEKEAAITAADETAKKAQEGVKNLEISLSEEKDRATYLFIENEEIRAKNDALMENARTLQVLQEEWREKGAALQGQVDGLTAEIAQARQWSVELEEARGQIVDLTHELALVNQQLQAEEEAHQGTSGRLRAADQALEEARSTILGLTMEQGQLLGRIEALGGEKKEE